MSFTKGMLIGGIVGASLSMMMNSDMYSKRNRRKTMKKGMRLIKRSGGIISDVTDIFR